MHTTARLEFDRETYTPCTSEELPSFAVKDAMIADRSDLVAGRADEPAVMQDPAVVGADLAGVRRDGRHPRRDMCDARRVREPAERMGALRVASRPLVRADPLGDMAPRFDQADADMGRELEGAHQPRVSRAEHDDMLTGRCVLVRHELRTAGLAPV